MVEIPSQLNAGDWHTLVADDDDDTRALMAGALRRAGFVVTEACDGEELVASFDALPASRALVVSDIGMPRCDGIAATIRIKRRAPSTVVLLVTAFGDVPTMVAARDAGADEVLRKPLSFDGLVRTALALIGRATA